MSCALITVPAIQLVENNERNQADDLNPISGQKSSSLDHFVSIVDENLTTSKNESHSNGALDTQFRKEGEIDREEHSFRNISINVPLPDYTKGIYLSNSTAHSKEKMKKFIKQAYTYGLNTFVIDIQSRMVPREIVDMLKVSHIFPVARIVVAEGGLKQKNFSKRHIQRIIRLIEDSASQGFGEIQLDYIRYADIEHLLGLSLSHKYKVIRSFLERAQQVADKNSVYLSADLFGRITLNQNDQIGQRLETFGEYTKTVYPMLYPSHYTNDPFRISRPYQTVKEGIQKSKVRLPNNRVVAYIQGFQMKIRPSGLSFVNYIKEQIRASEDASSDGWVIWNARNDYTVSFQAIQKFMNEKKGRNKQKILFEKNTTDQKLLPVTRAAHE